jgi:hypothetical protein
LRAALKPEPKPEPKPAPKDITHEIVAFESALRDAHQTVIPKEEPRRVSSVPSTQPPIFSEPALDQSFFDEFEQFANRDDLDADNMLDKDLLWRMKEFHRHRQEGKEYYLYSKDVQSAVQRKLVDLKNLEREWFGKRAAADELEKEVQVIESEIEARTADLKQLFRQAKAKSKLEERVPEGQEFILRDGRKLANLLDLKLALHTMPEPVFSHHVSSVKNDFAAWVRGALGDAKLANEMGTIRDKTQLEMFLAKLG